MGATLICLGLLVVLFIALVLSQGGQNSCGGKISPEMREVLGNPELCKKFDFYINDPLRRPMKVTLKNGKTYTITRLKDMKTK